MYLNFYLLCLVRRIPNNIPYGLSASVWTDKGSKIFKMVNKLRAGVVWANTYNKFDPTVRSAATRKAASVAGPASIQLVKFESPSQQCKAMATVDITPSQFPPDRAVTVGPYSADMKVTMEMSTDLVNWTVAQNAAVYTNKPEARFFRIKLEKDIPAP